MHKAMLFRFLQTDFGQ